MTATAIRNCFDWRPWAVLLAAGVLLAGCHFGFASVGYSSGYPPGGYYAPYYNPYPYYGPPGHYPQYHRHYRHRY